MTRPPDQRPGAERPRLPGLRLREELGHGARTVVYRAEREGREYAVKVQLGTAPGTEEETALAFRREASMLACVHHPGLAEIHEVGVADGRPYLVMELLEGRTLAEVIRAGHLGEAALVRIAIDVAGALAAAHRLGLAHRDVKPANVIVLPTGHAKVIDFGLATAVGEVDTTGTVAGTLQYASPEQSGMLHRPVDGRSDLYSLGVMMVECATGTPPFTGADVAEVVRQHAVVVPPELRARRPDVSPALSAIVAKLLAKDPDDRYQTGEGLVADLDRVLAGETQFELGEDDRPAATAYDLPLIGRDDELRTLVAKWVDARAGFGSVAHVEAPSGAGKSRLVRELVTRVQGDGALVLQGECEADNPVPFAALRRGIDQHVREIGRLPQAEQHAARNRLRAAAGKNADVLAELAPGLAEALGCPRGRVRADEGHFLSVVASFVYELARSAGGALLWVDDVQWVDEATQHLLAVLAASAESSYLLVLTTSREDEASRPSVDRYRAAIGPALTTDVHLGPLADDAVAELVRSQLGGAWLDEDAARLLALRCSGSPFAAVEFARAVLRAGLVRPTGGRSVVDHADLARVELPSDVLGLVRSRIDGLDEETRSVLTAAAAYGGSFRIDIVAQACGTSPQVALAAVTEARWERLVQHRDGGGFVFVHDRIRQALLSRLTDAAAADLHHRIAIALEEHATDQGGEVYALARHHALGGRDHQRIVATSYAAGKAALLDHAAADAVVFLERAEAAAADGSLPLDATFEATLGMAYDRAGRARRARVHLSRAVELEPDRWARAGLLVSVARVDYDGWQLAEAREQIDRALADVGHRMPANRLLLVLTSIGWALASIAARVARLVTGPGTAAAQRRRETLVRLHDSGAQISYVALDRLRMICHALRGLYPMHRAGPAPVCLHLRNSHANIAALYGWRRLATRMSERNRTIAHASGDPALVAATRLAECLTVSLLGQHQRAVAQFVAVLADDDRWLDLMTYNQGVVGLSWELGLKGHDREALAVYATALERAKRSAAPGSYRATLIALQAGHRARVGEPIHSDVLRMAELAASTAPTRAYRAKLYGVLAAMHVEDGELGAPFEAAVAAVHEAGLRPTDALYLRGFWFAQAAGRLQQCEAAPKADRPAALAAAVAAVRAAEAAASVPLLDLLARAFRAQLLHLQGDHRAAVARAADVGRDGLELDAPLVQYESSWTLAAGLEAMGEHAEAQRCAERAQSIARQQGWPTRSRRVAVRFGLTSPAASMVRPARTATTSADIGRHEQRLDALLQVSVAASAVIEPKALARVALDESLGILGAERGFLFLLSEDGTRLDLFAGRDAAGADLGAAEDYSTTLVERAWTEQQAFVVTGTQEGAALGSESAVFHGLRSIMVTPVQFDGRLLGVVYLDSRLASGVFTADDVDMLVAISNQVAVSLETARAARLEVQVEAARRQRGLAEQLRDAMATLSSTLDSAEVLSRSLEVLGKVVPFDRGCVVLVDGDAVQVAATSRCADPGDATVHLATEPVLSAVLAAGRPTFVTDSRLPARPPPLRWLLEPAGSWLAVPLVSRGRTVGALVVTDQSVGAYDETLSDLAAAFVGQSVVAYENARLFSDVQRLATTDELSQLGNRRHFFDRGSHVFALGRRSGRPLAAAMIDIDHFKQVNDTHGHAVGDEVIREVAGRIRQQVRDVDILARYGGEEFALVLADAGTGALDVAERIRAAVANAPIDTAAGPVPITISVGVAVVAEDDTDLEALVSRADDALYQAKQAGRDRVMPSVVVKDTVS
ncbi:MAG TPA: diguanylate cyclase [Euzebya sp.]|nr:diguanylate cyclase [Euzebya sp.]